MNVSVFTFTHQKRYFRFVDEATRSTGRDVEMALQWEIKTALVLGLLIRTGVVLYGEWQDRNSIVKFTDVDYNVFTDAAEYMTQVIYLFSFVHFSKENSDLTGNSRLRLLISFTVKVCTPRPGALDLQKFTSVYPCFVLYSHVIDVLIVLLKSCIFHIRTTINEQVHGP